MDKLPVFSMSCNRRDAALVVKVVNQGIDARLEGFTESQFIWGPTGRLLCEIATEHELQILIRRLHELATDDAEQLADDIVYSHYGHETI